MTTIETVSLSNNEVNNLEEKTIKLLLEKLKQIFSLNQIIETIISETTISEKEKSNENSNNELNNIINIMCKKTGVIKMFSYLLEDPEKVESIKHNNIQKNEPKNKTISVSSTIEDDIIEINNNDDMNDVKIIDNNIIKVDDEDAIKLTDSDNSIDNKIISIYDNEKIFNYGREGVNSELKRKRKRDDNEYYDKKYKINSVEKCLKKKKDLINEKIRNLHYHCSLINNIYFKYRLITITNKGFARFICYNPKCPGYGIYNLKNKMFTLLRGHNIKNNYTSCINMDVKDRIYYSYMISHDIVEMQITNE